MARVFVSSSLPGDALRRLQDRHETEIWPHSTDVPAAELRRRAGTAHGLLTLLSDRVDAELLSVAPELMVVANYAVGYDNIDVAAAAARGIRVGNTPDVLTEATADLAWALLMTAARHLPEAVAGAREGRWLRWEPGGHLGAEVHGATLGIIGGGRIGRAVARRAQGFQMNVITVGRGSGQAELADLLRRSDFVSLHCPLTPATRHLINRHTLALMKPTAILVNTARGGVVDQAALADALRRGALAGAGLDVTDPEPLPAGDPLYDAPNTIVTPHIGSATRAARERMAELAVGNLLAGLAGEPLPHPVPGSPR